MVSVNVRSDQNLIAGEVFLSESQGDLMCGFGCYRFVRVEGLHDVVVLSADCLAVLQLGIHHFVEG